MYTEFFAIWTGSAEQDAEFVNSRISELKKMNVGNIEVYREREKDILYITVTYFLRPGDEDHEENQAVD